jgi:hypothetical protein
MRGLVRESMTMSSSVYAGSRATIGMGEGVEVSEEVAANHWDG